MSKVMRSVKNVTKGYSAVQVKVRNATSNDPWGPTGTEMSEIAQITFNAGSNDFYEVMDMLDKRLNDKGKNWRHVLKALKVLDYSLHEGSELVVTWARKNIFIIKTLREFQHVDEDGRDVGQNVRVSAKELTSLILDEERLRTERQGRKTWKSRVTGIEEYGPAASFGSDSTQPRRKPERREQRADEEDAEYKLAIEASKYEAEEEKKRRQKSTVAPDDDDLQKAIKLSKEEEELRRRELEESNAAALFDDTPGPSTQPQFTGYNQGYQQQGAVDWAGNPLDQQGAQQPNQTGYLNAAYGNTTGYTVQNQQTGYQNGFPTGYPNQMGGFDQQQYQPQQSQQNFGQPQSSFFDSMNNPYGQTGNDFTGYNQQQQQQQPSFQQQDQQLGYQQAGNNNPWATQNQSQEALKPAPTGSNNPFASSFSRPTPQQGTTTPTLSTLTEQKAQTQFNNHNFNPSTSFGKPSANPPKEQNPQHARLNALLASGEGMDTFGNTGDLRIPAQHTAPGTFVNSAGQGIGQNATGNNPFFQQQFTGMPQNRLVPAQTGPANANNFGVAPFGGQGSNNPFGQNPSNVQQRQQQQGGSLIDL
ncbi:MAG: hypothetical protein M1833_004480 [Piccolia ochrophora]|nr:MAG: hypothetical protein M1833_004480 [Piccolia ochrophora]